MSIAMAGELPRGARHLSGAARRARTLLLAGLAGGHVAVAVCVLAFALAQGRLGAASALVGGAITLFFYAGGQAVQVAFADAPAQTVFVAAMTSYVVRVSLLGLALAGYNSIADRLVLLPTPVFVTVVATVLGWLAVEIAVFARMRIPVYETRFTRDENGGRE